MKANGLRLFRSGRIPQHDLSRTNLNSIEKCPSRILSNYHSTSSSKTLNTLVINKSFNCGIGYKPVWSTSLRSSNLVRLSSRAYQGVTSHETQERREKIDELFLKASTRSDLNEVSCSF